MGLPALRRSRKRGRIEPGRPYPVESGRNTSCPSQPPRSTPRCSTGPRPGASPTRRSTSRSSQTLNAALRGFAEAEQRRHRPGLHRRRRVPVRPHGQGHGHRRGRARRVRARGRQEVRRSTSRCTPTTAPRTSWTASSGRCSRSPPSGSSAARTRCSSRTCGTARPCRWTRTWRSPTELLALTSGRQDHPRGRDRRRRRRGGRRRRRDQRQAVHHRRGRPGHRRGARAWARRAATSPPSPSATCTASTSRATSSCARRSSRRSRSGRRQVSARTSRSTWSSTAAPARLLEEIRGRGRLRRDQDEHRHRHPVRLHPPGRRPHVHATTTAC